MLEYITCNLPYCVLASLTKLRKPEVKDHEPNVRRKMSERARDHRALQHPTLSVVPLHSKRHRHHHHQTVMLRQTQPNLLSVPVRLMPPTSKAKRKNTWLANRQHLAYAPPHWLDGSPISHVYKHLLQKQDFMGQPQMLKVHHSTTTPSNLGCPLASTQDAQQTINLKSAQKPQECSLVTHF